MTEALFHLRCVQIGLSMADLECLSMGACFDMFTESANDEVEYVPLADQTDIDRLKR